MASLVNLLTPDPSDPAAVNWYAFHAGEVQRVTSYNGDLVQYGPFLFGAIATGTAAGLALASTVYRIYRASKGQAQRSFRDAVFETDTLVPVLLCIMYTWFCTQNPVSTTSMSSMFSVENGVVLMAYYMRFPFLWALMVFLLADEDAMEYQPSRTGLGLALGHTLACGLLTLAGYVAAQQQPRVVFAAFGVVIEMVLLQVYYQAAIGGSVVEAFQRQLKSEEVVYHRRWVVLLMAVYLVAVVLAPGCSAALTTRSSQWFYASLDTIVSLGFVARSWNRRMLH